MIRGILILLISFSVQFVAVAELKVLLIGNSYSGANNLSGVLESMANDAHPPQPMTVNVIWQGGWTLSTHLASPAVLNAIATGGYDYIFLQDQSQRPAYDSEGTKADGRDLDDLIIASGAQTGFFMTWGRESGWPYIEDLEPTYTSIATELDAALVPVGLVWDEVRTSNPSFSLYTGDGSHPNHNGTYLAACTFFTVLTKHSPVGLSTGGLTVSEADALYIQNTVWNVMMTDFGYTPLPTDGFLGELIATLVILMVGIFFLIKNANHVQRNS